MVAENQLSPGEHSVYQADDQMLSFELLSRKEASWTSTLVAEAKVRLTEWCML